jgi:hypothetical protein
MIIDPADCFWYRPLSSRQAVSYQQPVILGEAKVCISL